MALKSMAYDNPAYLARGAWTSAVGTGSGTASGAKFVAHANMLLMSLGTTTTAVGTSTYTTGLTGGPTGATVAVAAQQLSVIRITNTASAGATIGLSTSTLGPFTVGGVFLGAGGTATNQVSASNLFPINTTAGTAGLGGVAINQGDQIFVVNGTDATATESFSIEWQLLPGAAVVA